MITSLTSFIAAQQKSEFDESDDEDANVPQLPGLLFRQLPELLHYDADSAYEAYEDEEESGDDVWAQLTLISRTGNSRETLHILGSLMCPSAYGEQDGLVQEKCVRWAYVSLIIHFSVSGWHFWG